MSRYPALFQKLQQLGEGAFVPFVMLGDPDAETSLTIIEQLIVSGADALELGVPFSDPVADGPTIQAAHIRAQHADVHVDTALGIVRKVRDAHPDLPIGLLIYGNVAFARGADQFYPTSRPPAPTPCGSPTSPFARASPSQRQLRLPVSTRSSLLRRTPAKPPSRAWPRTPAGTSTPCPDSV